MWNNCVHFNLAQLLSPLGHTLPSTKAKCLAQCRAFLNAQFYTKLRLRFQNLPGGNSPGPPMLGKGTSPSQTPYPHLTGFVQFRIIFKNTLVQCACTL